MRNPLFWAGVMAVSMLVSSLCLAGDKSQSRLVRNLEAGKKQVIVTYGTSLTANGAWVKQLGDTLKSKYPGLVEVQNSGGSGKWSEWGVQNLEERVLRKNPDTVFIEFAINDSVDRFKTTVEGARSNLCTMIDRILKARPDCEIILMAMNPVTGKAADSRSRLPEFYQMYRDVAKTRGLSLIDHYPQWKQVLDKDPALFRKYVPDGLHPGAEGCSKVITPEISKALGIGE